MQRQSHYLTEDLLKVFLQTILLALDFLHTDCKLVHTDIKTNNILICMDDKSVLDDLVNTELSRAPAHKVKNGVTVYASRGFQMPKTIGMLLLGDIGEAISGHTTRCHDAQPAIYRAPEVMLEADWSYPVNIWNLGVMIWDLFEGKDMFTGNVPDVDGYSTKAHLAELIGVLGLPPDGYAYMAPSCDRTIYYGKGCPVWSRVGL